MEDHTSGDFATDLAAGKWLLTSPEGAGAVSATIRNTAGGWSSGTEVDATGGTGVCNPCSGVAGGTEYEIIAGYQKWFTKVDSNCQNSPNYCDKTWKSHSVPDPPGGSNPCTLYETMTGLSAETECSYSGNCNGDSCWRFMFVFTYYEWECP